MSERATQNEIRNALAGVASIFRANVGTGWTGDVCDVPGGKLIRNPRPLSSGLPPGFADLVGWVCVEITPSMIGQRVAVFVAIEVKAPHGRPSDAQQRFIAAVQSAGGRAGVARSANDAIAIVEGQ